MAGTLAKREALLQQADTYGPDHLTPVGATPLMLAAMAGNAPLVQALLDKGADPQRRDDFGHTAWDCALDRALRELGFAGTGLAAVFPLLAPAALTCRPTVASFAWNDGRASIGC